MLLLLMVLLSNLPLPLSVRLQLVRERFNYRSGVRMGFIIIYIPVAAGALFWIKIPISTLVHVAPVRSLVLVMVMVFVFVFELEPSSFVLGSSARQHPQLTKRQNRCHHFRVLVRSPTSRAAYRGSTLCSRASCSPDGSLGCAERVWLESDTTVRWGL